MNGIIFWIDLPTKEQAEKKFDQIIENYKFINIKPIKVIRQRHKMSAHFENGDCWQCLAPLKDTRGIKANLVYIPQNICGGMKMRAIATAVAKPYNGVIYY